MERGSDIGLEEAAPALDGWAPARDGDCWYHIVGKGLRGSAHQNQWGVLPSSTPESIPQQVVGTWANGVMAASIVSRWLGSWLTKHMSDWFPQSTATS